MKVITIEQANAAITHGDAFWVEPYSDGDSYLVNEFAFDVAGVMADISAGVVYASSAQLRGANGEAEDVEITF